MKKLISFVLAMALVLSLSAAAMADGRTAPEDKKVVITDDLGVETLFTVSYTHLTLPTICSV